MPRRPASRVRNGQVAYSAGVLLGDYAKYICPTKHHARPGETHPPLCAACSVQPIRSSNVPRPKLHSFMEWSPASDWRLSLPIVVSSLRVLDRGFSTRSSDWSDGSLAFLPMHTYRLLPYGYHDLHRRGWRRGAPSIHCQRHACCISVPILSCDGRSYETKAHPP